MQGFRKYRVTVKTGREDKIQISLRLLPNTLFMVNTSVLVVFCILQNGEEVITGSHQF
jgi:hypothetical protein